MIKPEDIPPEVVEAFQKAWAVTSTLSTKECLAAALNAWPDMSCRPTFGPSRIILPLNTETDNAEV